jgi:rubrerythrin
MNMSITSIVSAAALGIAIVLAPAAHAAVSQKTLQNLNTAYQGESNASNRYAKFAIKAEEEGYAQVAKLFRAASAAEAIHRESHKAAIQELGGTVDVFELEAVTPATTAENLKAAIKGETYERDTMYPEFLAVAKSDNARPAMKTLEWARTAEKEHAMLYQDALDNLGKNPTKDYFVCQVCGMTLTELPAKKCPSCRRSRDEYKKIN